MSPVGALIMLAGIYYGAHHGGSTTAILVNLPGEPSSVIICIDGHPMARQGRAGPALASPRSVRSSPAPSASLLIALFGPPLAEVALEFAAPEYIALMLMASSLRRGARRWVVKSIAMVALGLLLGTIGRDVNTG